MIHLFLGDGQGKTSAAVGLVVRSLNYAKKILFVAFLKSGDSGELTWLNNNSTVEILAQADWCGFVKDCNPQEFTLVKDQQRHLWEKVKAQYRDYQLIVLDELTDLITLEILSLSEVLEFLQNSDPDSEIVITGHQIYPELVVLADYYSELKQHQHPYQKGQKARPGNEF